MKQTPSWEVSWFSGNQENPHILWNLVVYHLVYKRPPPVPILSQINPVHAPHSTSWGTILILSFHLCLGLPIGLFLSGFPTETLYIPLLSPISATCLTHHTLLNFITWTLFGDKCRSLSSSLCSFFHSPVTSSLSPNILLNTLFSITLRLCFSPSVSDQVSHPYKTTGRFIVLYILIFMFLDSKLEDRRYYTE